MARLTTVGESAALSKELADFLIEFSIGLHKNAIYPPGHPMLEDATSELARRLGQLMSVRNSLSLGVARNQLIIEGVATDEHNPVLRELASRLHRHHLGAVKFSSGVGEEELTHMLATVAVEAGRLPRPLGLEGPEVLAQWPHIRLFPLTFEQLQLLEEDPDGEDDDSMRASGKGSRSAALWIGLARAALASEAEKLDADSVESTAPEAVAKAIDEHKRDAAYDQVVVGYLLQIAEELKSKSGKDAAALQRRISQLISTLSPDTLGRLLEMGGDKRQRRKFVMDASQGMAVDAVVELVRAASDSSGQTISHSMVRMLSKLAVHADEGPTTSRRAADGALREQVGRLLSDWELDDPNPDGYRLALEKMARAAPLFRSNEHSFPIEPERLLAMGIEIKTLGEQVWRSLDVLAARDDMTPLVQMLDGTPEGWLRDTLWRHVATPARLRAQLAVDPFPTATVHRLIEQLGAGAASPLLDALEESEDERTQERLLDLLAELGQAAGIAILARLPGARWTLVRPLLALLGKHPEWECAYTPHRWLNHPDPTVRREALRQLLRAPDTRDSTIVAALADADERNVRLGLGAAMTGCPTDAAKLLRIRADDQSLSADLRALGIRALSSHPAPDTPLWLANRVVTKGRVLRRVGLASKTPEMLAALEGLATHWRDDPAAREAMSLASASTDPEILAAVARRGGSA